VNKKNIQDDSTLLFNKKISQNFTTFSLLLQVAFGDYKTIAALQATSHGVQFQKIK
jgi:hypothetical protein